MDYAIHTGEQRLLPLHEMGHIINNQENNMDKIKAVIEWIKNNKKIVIPVAIALAILLAFGIGYIKGCVG